MIVFFILVSLWYTFFKIHIPFIPVKLFLGILFITLGIFVIGFFDDTSFLEIKNIHKLIYELCLVTGIVLVFNVQLNTIHFFDGHSLSLGWLGIPLSILWITGVTNAVNIIDGIDGLAGMVVCISFIGIAIVAGISGNMGLCLFCCLCIALLIGFLLHNLSPARIFLGDTGALFFGSILGILTVYMTTLPGTSFSIFALPLIIGYPLVDIVVAMIRRYCKKTPLKTSLVRGLKDMFVPDNEHIHHRLHNKGLDHQKITILLSLFSLILVTAGISISFFSSGMSLLILLYCGAITLWLLNKLHFYDGMLWKKTKIKRATSSVKKIPIHVINADAIAKHSLQQYQQDYLQFYFSKKNDSFANEEKKGTVIFFNNSNSELQEDIDYLTSWSYQQTHQMFLAADKKLYDSIDCRAIPENISFFNRNSLYIPQLLRTIYPKAQSDFNCGAFKVAFNIPYNYSANRSSKKPKKSTVRFKPKNDHNLVKG